MIRYQQHHLPQNVSSKDDNQKGQDEECDTDEKPRQQRGVGIIIAAFVAGWPFVALPILLERSLRHHRPHSRSRAEIFHGG